MGTQMPDYLSQRQNAITTDPEIIIELNGHLETIATEFGLPWLERTSGSPVQELWKARDAQATNELLILGHAIQNLKKVDAGWTRRQIAQMKTGSIGEQSGAAFEIIGLNLFAGPGQRIAPAPTNKPGYDGSVFFDDGASLMVSIKNHGITSHETTFLAKAEEIRSEFVEGLRTEGAKSAKMRAISQRHPTTADWAALRGHVREFPSGKPPEESPVWAGCVDPLPAEYSPLSSKHVSYAFILTAPFHPNEQKNFQDNIRKGIANMEKHCAAVAPDVCRTLLMRLSATASMPDCEKWANDYFVQYPNTKVELILLYQAVPAVDLQTKKSSITHYFLSVTGPNFVRWQKPSRRFVIHPLIGTIQQNPSWMIMSDGERTAPLDGHYVFQRGEIFRFFDLANGPVNAELSNPAPGVFINAVIGDMALEMRAPKTPRLLLLP